jgi:hypothetical protein
MTLPRPAVDPELSELLTTMPLTATLTPDLLAQIRQYPSPRPRRSSAAVPSNTAS